ncbi:TPA: MucBP domain-containing protein, partial [Streptococcus suis]
MRRTKKKSFDWYGTRQHFSIRKYHFGAASVLLGMSLAVGTGTTVQAEDTILVAETLTSSTTVVSSTDSEPSSETSEVTSTDMSASTSSNTTTSDTQTENTETSSSLERKATINYIIQYIDEAGSLVDAALQTIIIPTADVVGTATVEISLELPTGYVLAPGQSASVSQELTEGAENIVTVKVVKKEAVAASTNATTETSTTAENVGETPTTSTSIVEETVKTPATVEEAKVVLEQVTSEAEVLANEAERLVAASDSDNTALKAAAAATKLTATEATAVLNASTATLEAVNAQIDAVRTNVEALALELRKFLGTDLIQVALFELAGTTAGLNNIGDGVGTLIKTDTTVSAPMTDAAGAAVSSRVQSPYAPTAVDGYYTMNYMSVSYYDAIMGYQRYKPYGGLSTGGAYFRTSIKSANVADPILIELVAKDGTLLESHYMTPNVSKDFTYFQATSGVNKPMTATIRTDVASDTVLGQIFIQFDDNTIATATDTRSLPSTLISQSWEYTTYYKTTADSTNEALATYTVVGVPGNTVTPSGVREFGGYEYVNTTTENIQVNQVAGAPYVERTRAHVNGTYHKSIATPIGTDGSIKLDLYFADPNYAGTPNFEDTSTEGFIKILETQTMGYTQSNTTHTLSSELFDNYPIYFVDASTEADVGTDKGPVPVKGTRLTSADQMDLLKLTSTAQYYQITFKENAAAGELSFARIGVGAVGSTRQLRIEYNVKGDGTETNTETGVVRTTTYKGTFIPITLQNQPNIITETTHWYRPVIQEAIIRYQVEGATDYLEDSGTLTGNPGTDINYSTTDIINKYKKLGYELVSDNFTTDAGQDYDYNTAVKQEFLVVIKPRIVDVPKDAVPGQPVDPTDPNSPVWPATVENLETTQEVTRKVEYKYEDGTPVRVDAAGNVLPKDSTEGTPLVKTETVTFTRPAQVNLVTGEVTYGEWTADTTDTLSGNQIPAITDYTATRTTLEGADAPMSETVIPKKVAATDADINEVVYYTPNPKYGDVVVNYVNTDGKVIAKPVVDTNDALVGTDYSTADQVPEKIVEDATGDVYYYKEIKPEDATKETGTVVEGTTEVTYVYEKAGDVVIKYVDVNGLELQAPDADTTDGKPGSDYNTAEGTEKPATLTTADGKVYALVPAGDYPVGTVATDNNLTSGATPTGTVEAGVTKEVTYVYQEVKSDVVVEYYDREGNPISGTETGNATSVVDTEDASVGTAYNTDDKKPATITEADGTVYYYKEVKDTSAPTTGKVAETTTTVQYVYEKAGSVNVNYVDVNGTEIKADVLDVENGQPGSNYDTLADNRPDTIVATDGKTYKLVPAGDYPVGTVAADSNLASGATPTGAVEAGVTKEVTYVYQEVKGNVIVNYVDENGNPIAGITDAGTQTASTVEDTPESSTGTDYNTTDLRPNTITTADGKIYKLVPSAIPANETGKVVEGTTEVTYVYELVQGDVVVHYVDTEGNTIAKDVTDTKVSDTGTDYDTTDNKPAKLTAEDGTVYYILPQDEVKAGSAPETGKVVEGTTEVTYVYQKAGDVVVNYTLADGTVIKDPVNDETNQEPGYDYSTTDNKPETITTTDGKVYKLVPTATIGNETGDVAAGKTIEVTYIYEEVKSDVVVEYYNTAGEVIAKTVVDEDDKSVGTVYNTDEDNRPETITTADGTVYYYKEVKDTSAPTTGKVAETTTTVQYVYEKAGDVIVHYITIDGTPISGVTNTGSVTASTVDDTVNGKPGSTYDTSDLRPTTITTDEGKTYELIPTATIGNETGNVEAGKTTEVTYVYKEVKGSVVVNYVTTDGTVLQAPVTDTPETSTGTAYDTRDVKPETITTADGKIYKLVPTLTQGFETGDVVPGVTEVTYVYEEVKGDVVVNYVNTAGEVIAPQVVDTKTTSTGTAYDTTDNKPAKIIAEDGTVYYYKEVDATSATETGKVVEGTTEITYVYEQAGFVTVNYVTTDGTVIKSPVKDEENAEPGKTYSTEDNKPTTITTEDGKTYELIPTATIGNETGNVEAGKTTEVTYVYKEVKGSVVVNYVTTDGTVLQAPVTDTPETSTGTAYDTTDNKPETITTEDGTEYKLVPVLTKGEETGSVVEGTTQVTYVYQKVTTPAPNPNGSVVVNYVNTNGETIATSVNDTTDVALDTAYDTTDYKPEVIKHNGVTYFYKEVKTGDNETGKVIEGTTEVTYIYEPAGSVTVNYVTTDGTVIKSPVKDEENVEPGKAYTTEDNKPTIITTEDGKTYKLVPSLTTGEENGSVASGEDKQITYVYEEITGNVVVNYIDTEGNVIKEPVTDTPVSSTGTSYDTTDNKPTSITTEDGSVYELIPVLTKGEESGKIVAGTTQVTYIYRKVFSPTPVEQTGNVVVEYYNAAGEKIAEDVVDTPETTIGTVYETLDYKPTTITKDGILYFYKEVKDTSATEKGRVVEGTTTVQYVYEPAGAVTVNYVTTDGTVIKPLVKDEVNAEPGKTYSTEDQKTTVITTEEGKTYKLIPSLTTGEENGTITSGEDKQVTYVYEEVTGDVVVNYIDTEGNVIKAPVTDTPVSSTGTNYDTTDHKPTTITTEDGSVYELLPVLTKGEESGKVVAGTTQVTYVYRKVSSPTPVVQNGNVVVEYFNTAGDKIAEDVVDTPESTTGTVYETLDQKPATISKDGVLYFYKELKDTSAAEKGRVVEGTTTVQYVYEPAGSVTVNYVTTDGTVIKPSVKDEVNAEPGKTYSTEDQKTAVITTEEGKTYKLVPSLTTGEENGTITSGEDKQVTYVYEEITGDVVVNYIDTEGNVIKAPVTDTPVSSTGTNYDTTDHKPTTITTEDGSVYELLSVLTKGEESGKVVAGSTHVTYVYRKVVAPILDVKTGSVVIRYVEAGTESNVLSNPVLDEYNVEVGTKFDTTDEGDKLVEIIKDGARYVLVPSKTVAVDSKGNLIAETGEVTEGTTIVTYKYKKVANWIPQIPVTPESPTPVNPVIPYPFDPTNPDKPVDPTTPYPGGEVPSIPHVPGYTPVDPKTNEPLKPVDPTDPNKGYVPPTPDESGIDTPIPYVQNGNVVVNYVTEDGTVIKAPVQDETDAPAGKSYDTTDNKPNTITTEDGTTYELVRVEGSETGTVVGGKTTEVTYVYRNVETPAKKVVTNHVDENGTPLAPQEEGTTPSKS